MLAVMMKGQDRSIVTRSCSEPGRTDLGPISATPRGPGRSAVTKAPLSVSNVRCVLCQLRFLELSVYMSSSSQALPALPAADATRYLWTFYRSSDLLFTRLAMLPEKSIWNRTIRPKCDGDRGLSMSL